MKQNIIRRISKLNMAGSFEKWLVQNGAEILPLTNSFEKMRFKGSEVGVLYKSGKYNSTYAENAFKCYENGKPWNGRPLNVGRNSSYVKQKKILLKRDGDVCFYCGNKLFDDVTVEHLVSLVSGGKNSIGNMVLSHEKCNQSAGNKTVVEKVNLAIQLRTQLKK